MKCEHLEHMGSDDRVADAARVSFEKEASNFTKEQNDKLISYLARHNHWSPFSHPQITLRYTVPIFVARQEFKHIVGFSRNEVSRRYVDDAPEFYVPEVWRSRPEGSVKQGSGGPVEDQLPLETLYETVIASAKDSYNLALELGASPEQARMMLPQSMYTSYYITGSLAAFARFYKQRTDSNAQQEISELAQQVQSIIEPLFPISWEALTEVE